MVGGKWLFPFLLIAALVAVIWASDRITLQGERTIYTVECVGGAWQDLLCTGEVKTGARYRFRASKTRGEVVHWIAGSAERSGKMTDCTVRDRGNWSCKTPDSANPAIAQAMVNDRLSPKPGSAAITFHMIAKWKWWAIYWGVPGFHQADY
jgi:hypothetical protein